MKTDNQPQHTQGEWNTNLTNDMNPDLAIFCKGLQIATIEPLANKDEMKANAQRIVKAVNMHDELIAKLKNLASSARANNDYDCDRGLQEAVEDAEEFISENL